MSGWIDFFMSGWDANATFAGAVARSSGSAVAGRFTRPSVGVGYARARRFPNIIVVWPERRVRRAAKFVGRVVRSIGRAIEGVLIGSAAMAGTVARAIGAARAGSIPTVFTGAVARSGCTARSGRIRNHKIFVVAKPKVVPFRVKDQEGVLPRPAKVFRVK